MFGFSSPYPFLRSSAFRRKAKPDGKKSEKGKYQHRDHVIVLGKHLFFTINQLGYGACYTIFV